MLAPFARLAALAVAAVALAPADARAGFLNANFSNGGSGWVVDPTGAQSVVFANNTATLNETATDQFVTLYQNFTIDVGTTGIRCRIAGFRTNTNIFGGLPDYFEIALVDPTTAAPLTGTVDPLSTAYYNRQLVTGAADELFGAGVTVTDLGAQGYDVTLMFAAPLQSITAARSARLAFTMGFGGDDTDAFVTLGGVQLLGQQPGGGGGPNPVPGPHGLVLALTAGPVVFLVRRFRRS
ncbi:MAG: hypothetical protein K2V38_23520 [Gemmataceae bacterium]|nr:hypothetical protein [Gemmataceae bacterium]